MNRHKKTIYNQNPKSNSDKGFTLVEICIAMAISGIVIVGIYSMYTKHHEIKISQEITNNINQNIRSALYIMKRELMFAGYDPEVNALNGLARTGITAELPDSITFSYVAAEDEIDNDGDGFIDADDFDGDIATVTFDVQATNLVRTDIWGAFPIAENIENIEFSYSDAAGGERMVRITLLVRGNKEEKTISNTAPTVYTLPDTGTQWTIPAGDHMRRRLTSCVIRCRNIGI
ncbi:MAG: prepilin-type N-terminal cleavage/methylation domain-containing protein [Proteobacteria bacterium]|nr:prepilin-type N-terminal cleavage/methylation domain-containing protein [Pseudomonadota bacterium]